MFKSSSVADELFHSMEKELAATKVASHGFDKLSKAADYLYTAANIFEQAGMNGTAEEITKVLQELALQLSGKTSV
jgi:hypothetical protein